MNGTEVRPQGGGGAGRQAAAHRAGPPPPLNGMRPPICHLTSPPKPSKTRQVNPNFADEVDATVGGDRGRPIILYCSQGGSIDPTSGQKRGFQTRCGCGAAGSRGRGPAAAQSFWGGAIPAQGGPAH
jgi:hypothetical protein